MGPVSGNLCKSDGGKEVRECSNFGLNASLRGSRGLFFCQSALTVPTKKIAVIEVVKIYLLHIPQK